MSTLDTTTLRTQLRVVLDLTNTEMTRMAQARTDAVRRGSCPRTPTTPAPAPTPSRPPCENSAVCRRWPALSSAESPPWSKQ